MKKVRCAQLFWLFLLFCLGLHGQQVIPPVDSVTQVTLQGLPLPSTYEQAIELAQDYQQAQSLDTFIAYHKQALAYARRDRNEAGIASS